MERGDLGFFPFLWENTAINTMVTDESNMLLCPKLCNNVCDINRYCFSAFKCVA